MRNNRPGDGVALAAIAGAAACYFGVPGWVIVIGALAIGWGFNEAAKRKIAA